jgi:hypothetical protein
VGDELKGFGRKRSWPNYKVLSGHSPGGTEENQEKHRHLKLLFFDQIGYYQDPPHQMNLTHLTVCYANIL